MKNWLVWRSAIRGRLDLYQYLIEFEKGFLNLEHARGGEEKEFFLSVVTLENVSTAFIAQRSPRFERSARPHPVGSPN